MYFLFIVFVCFRLLNFSFFHLCSATTCVGEIKLYIISHQVGSMKSTERVVSSYKKHESRMTLANAQEAT